MGEAKRFHTDEDVLVVLRAKGPCTIAGIARHLGVSATSIRNRLYRRLVPGKLVAVEKVYRQEVRNGVDCNLRGRPYCLYSILGGNGR
jgi:predicted ArsR family transcriptional regulator